MMKLIHSFIYCLFPLGQPRTGPAACLAGFLCTLLELGAGRPSLGTVRRAGKPSELT